MESERSFWNRREFLKVGGSSAAALGMAGTDAAASQAQCSGASHPNRYALSQALHHHSVLVGKIGLCRSSRLRRRRGDAGAGVQSWFKRQCH